MTPNKHPLRIVFAALAWALALPALSQSSIAKKLYCWNHNGQRVCSDTLPSEAVNQARDEFNAKSGLRSAEVEHAMSSEERAADIAAKQQREADQAAEQTRQRTDQAMLMSYQHEEDLRQVFNKRIAIIDNNIRTANYNVVSLREGLVGLLCKASDQELTGQAVSAKLSDAIQQRHRALYAQLRLQQSFEQQRAALEEEITQTLQRYRALKAPAPAAG